MKNLKYIIGFACFGLILSLAIAAAHHVSFGPAIGRALISAIVFGVISFVATYLLNQFSASDYTPSVSDEDGGNKKKSSTSTHTVDLYIEDEELPSQSDEAAFVVGNSHQMLNPSDVNPESPFGKTLKVPPKKKQNTPQSAPVNNSATATKSATSNQKSTSQNTNQSTQNADSTQGDSNFIAPQVAPPKPNDFTPITLGSGKNGTEKDIERAERVSAKNDKGDALDVLPDIDTMMAQNSNVEVPTQDADLDKNSILTDNLSDKTDDAYVGGSSNFAKGGKDVTATPKSEGKADAATTKTDTQKASSTPKTAPATQSAPVTKSAPGNKEEPSGATNARGNKVEDNTDISDNYSGEDDDDDLESVDAGDGGDSDASDDDDDAGDAAGGSDEYLPSAKHLEASSVVEGKDVNLMAKAISTLLLRDKE